MDPKYNGQLQHGQLQHGWGWILAAYLFFGGVGAGAYVIAALNGLLGGIEAGLTALGIAHGRGALDAASEVIARA